MKKIKLPYHLITLSPYHPITLSPYHLITLSPYHLITLLSPFFLIFSFFANSYSAGTSSASFLKIPWGARPSAMGEAFTAVGDDIDCIYWNPAGLVSVQKLQQSFGHNSWIDDMNMETLSFALRYNKLSVFGASLGYLNIGDIDMGNKYGNALGYYSASNMVFLFSYARVLNPKLSLGGNLKIITERIEDASGMAYALDVGAMYDYRPKIKLGAVIKDIGTGLNLNKTAGALPMSLRIGGSYQMKKNLTLTSDINFSFDDSLSFHLGSEYLYPSKIKGIDLSLRVGIKTSQMSYLGALSALTLGFGAQRGNIILDYALNSLDFLGLVHKLNLKMKFEGFAAKTTGEEDKKLEELSKNPQGVYKETMQWFYQRVDSEKLTTEQQKILLQKIIEKFSVFKIDLSEANNLLEGLKK